MQGWARAVLHSARTNTPTPPPALTQLNALHLTPSQFNDEFVAAHYSAFEGADDMRKSLLATTAMERFKKTQMDVRGGLAGPFSGEEKPTRRKHTRMLSLMQPSRAHTHAHTLAASRRHLHSAHACAASAPRPQHRHTHTSHTYITHTHTSHTSPHTHQAADAIMEAVASCVRVDLPEAYVRAVAEKEYQEKLLGMVGLGVCRGDRMPYDMCDKHHRVV